MSSKISLYFGSFREINLERKLNLSVEMIRLFCDVKFKMRDGWSDSYTAIIDTGAPISVIPFQIWSESEVEVLTDHKIKGVVPKKECTLNVLVGKIKCVLLDGRSFSREVEILAYLALTNKISLILGFKDLLSEFKLSFSYPNEAWLEEK